MEDKTFELIEKMYAEFTGRFDKMDNRFNEMDNKFDKMDNRLDKMDNRFDGMDNRLDGMDNRFGTLESEVRKINVTIEHDIMPKITALFDGQLQNTQQLERIEKEVTKHEDFILRRVK